MHVKGAHFLDEDVGLFDAAFFNFSAETAAVSVSTSIAWVTKLTKVFLLFCLGPRSPVSIST